MNSYSFPADSRHRARCWRSCVAKLQTRPTISCSTRAATPCGARAAAKGLCRSGSRAACWWRLRRSRQDRERHRAGSGPYAAALATELVKPGQSDLIMFHNVRVAVVDKTKGDQVPWTEDGIQRRQRVLFGGEAKGIPSSPMRLSEAAETWDRAKEGTNVAVLEAFIARYKDTFNADLARARIADLKKRQVTSSASKREQPTTLGGTLQCESYSDRPVCEFDPSCAWVDNGRRCQRKSGSLATAMLEASPASNSLVNGQRAKRS